MTHTIQARNAQIEVIDRLDNDRVYLNISHHADVKEGEYLQIILPRHIAAALAALLQQP